MIYPALDYFLYDNRSLSALGRDWGLKAATGWLKGEDALKERFLRYCDDSFDTRSSSLSGFQVGIGGFEASAGAYVVCVTLEVVDHFGRPSLAIVGLGFPTLGGLADFLESSDPVETARNVHTVEPLPVRLPPVGSSRLHNGHFRGETLRMRSGDPARVARFDPNRSPGEALEVLADAAGRGNLPPRILGVTSVFQPARFEEAGYSLVFCRPGSSVAELALDSYLEKPAREDLEPAFEDPEELQKKDRRPVRWGLTLGLLLLASVLVLLGSYYLMKGDGGQPAPPPIVDDPPLPDPGLTTEAPDPEPIPPPVSGLDLRAETEALVGKLGRLSAAALARTRALQIVTSVPVLPEHRAAQALLRQRLEVDLPQTAARLQDLNLAYYFEEQNRNLPGEQVMAEIRKKLQTVEIPTGICAELKDAFGFELEQADGVLADWCSTLEGFRALATPAAP